MLQLNQQVTRRHSVQTPAFYLSKNRYASQRGSISQSALTITIALSSLTFLVIMGFFYLQQVFNTATHAGEIQALESRVIELNESQRQLELEGAQLRSIQSVEERVERLNLSETDNVAYLAPETGQVALGQ